MRKDSYTSWVNNNNLSEEDKIEILGRLDNCLLKVHFSEGIFTKLVERLEDRGVVTVGDYLRECSKFNLLDFKNVGKTKVDKFNDKLSKLLEDKGLSNSVVSYNINKVHRNTPVFMLNKALADTLTLRGITNLTDINNFNQDEIIKDLINTKNIGRSSIKSLTNEFHLLEKDFITYLEIKLDDFKKFGNRYLVVKERINGKTLEEIGLKLGRTKEWVRRIQLQAFRDLSLIFKSLTTYYFDKGIIGEQIRTQISDLYVIEDNREIVDMFVFFIKKGMVENLRYSKNLDLILFNRLVSDLEETILNKVNEHGRVLSIASIETEVYADLVALGLDFLTVEDIKKFLLNTKYRKYNDYFTLHTPTNESLVAYLIYKNYPSGVDISDIYEDLALMVDYEFGISDLLSVSKRGIEAYAETSNDLIMCSRKKVTNVRNVGVSNSDIELIKSYIEKALNYTDKLRSSELYIKIAREVDGFRDIINNEYLFYGVIKYYLSDDFNIKRFSIWSKKG